MKKIIMIFLAVLMTIAVTVNAQSNHKFIQLIPGQDKLIIEPTSGKEKLVDGVSVTTDQNFRNYNLDQASPATTATSVEVYALTSEASFNEIFPTDTEKEKVALTTPQIKKAIEKYTTTIKNATLFFVVKNGGKFYILQAMVSEGAAGAPKNVKIDTWLPDDNLSLGQNDRFMAKKLSEK